METTNQGASSYEHVFKGIFKTYSFKCVFPKAHSHWEDSPTELVIEDHIAKPIFENAREGKSAAGAGDKPGGAGTTPSPPEYLTDTPYNTNSQPPTEPSHQDNRRPQSHRPRPRKGRRHQSRRPTGVGSPLDPTKHRLAMTNFILCFVMVSR